MAFSPTPCTPASPGRTRSERGAASPGAFGHDAAQGADTAVWLARTPEIDGLTGLFWQDRAPIPCKWRNPGAEEALFRLCEEMTR
jgi:hypothetical protein